MGPGSPRPQIMLIITGSLYKGVLKKPKKKLKHHHKSVSGKGGKGQSSHKEDGKKILTQHQLSPLQGSLNTARRVQCDKGALVLSSWWSLSVA